MSVSLVWKTDGMQALLQQLKTLKEKAVYVGFPAEFDETVEGSQNFNMASLAAVLEFGNQHIPSRPFLRQTLEQNQQKYAEFFTEQFKKGVPVETIYNRLALTVEADVKENIVKGEWAPNAKATIKRKKSSKPLIDTGKMRQSVRGIVK